MNTAKFSVVKTNDLTTSQFTSLVKSFNTVFEKNVTEQNFTRQYINNEKGYSYHSLMEVDGEIVGYFSAIPYNYSYFGVEKVFCYVGALFILPAFRNDPLAMFKLYRNAKKLMQEEGVFMAMAVPNKNAYPYFMHALKWKEISQLPYYALPVKYANITNSNKILNLFSSAFVTILLAFNSVLSNLYNSKERFSSIYLLPKEPLMEQHRYGNEHKKIKHSSFNAFYTVVQEEGVNTAYLINFYNHDNKRDSESLLQAVKFIVQNENIDLILFVGDLKMNQTVLFKVPKNKEPRAVNFCMEFLNKEDINEKAYDKSSWNFGLYNFDVR